MCKDKNDPTAGRSTFDGTVIDRLPGGDVMVNVDGVGPVRAQVRGQQVFRGASGVIAKLENGKGWRFT